MPTHFPVASWNVNQLTGSGYLLTGAPLDYVYLISEQSNKFQLTYVGLRKKRRFLALHQTPSI